MEEEGANYKVTQRLQAHVARMALSLRMFTRTCLRYISLKETSRHLSPALKMKDPGGKGAKRQKW